MYNHEMTGDYRMYYCLKCKEIHHQVKPGDAVFNTGFRRINGRDVPLGTCIDKKDAKKNP
ncbi:DUF3973 domain-containing protein [Alicyclobacillus fodiniaquatilis]|uniref:DUF3973 domain-containing protein n=1 Tax=Alicyclobacillus fodiniaquatilis TaxID=1661150 RepID=A0ABW4JIL1_9BACL